MDFFQAVGFIGMIFIVWAYLILQTGKHSIDSLFYQLLNLVGAILLIISLCVHFNLGSFLIEVFWIAITVYGIYKNIKYKKMQKENVVC